MTNQKFSVLERLASFGHAIRGLTTVVTSQHNAQIQLTVAVLVAVAGVVLEISSIEWCLVVISIACVLAAEAFNTALEFLTDVASPEIHPLAGRAKDAAAGAVLITAIGATIVGGIVFVPKVQAWL